MKAQDKRQNWVPILLCFVFGGLFLAGIINAAHTMIVEREFWTKVQRRLIKEGLPVVAKRGNILSDEGHILAASIPLYKVYLDFVVIDKNPKRQERDQHRRDSLFNLHVDSFAINVAQILPDVNPSQLANHLRKGHSKKSRYWPIYKKRINYEQYQALCKLPFFKLDAGKMGFASETFYSRTNPYGTLARRTIGALHKGKDAPQMGLEQGLDSLLRGKNGMKRIEKVRSTRLPIITQPAIDGFDVKTTINVKMQDIVEKMLSEKIKEVEASYGICILMEVKTGDVKAITTLLRNPETGSCYEGPNYAISQLMEPGSVFKPISFLVAMEDGKLSKEQSYDVGGGIKEMYGRKMRDANWSSGGSGLLTVPEMLAFSSNVGVSTMIDRAYRNNTKAFSDGVRRTGILEDYHLPFVGYARPRIPSLDPQKGVGHHVDLCWMSIGYATQIPPIYTLSFYNAVANGGRLVRPRFYTAKLKDGQIVREYPTVTVKEQIAKPQVILDMQEMLQGVVTKGYGKHAGSRYFSVAGKTGTAQVWTKQGRTAEYLVSFAGYFPADAPQYSMIVCLRKTGGASGGGMCAPVFRRIAESVMALRKNTNYTLAKDSINPPLPQVCAGNLQETSNVLQRLHINYSFATTQRTNGLVWGESQTTPSNVIFKRETTPPNTLPNLHGYGIRDAVYRLELLGLKVKHKGVGLVVAQSLPPGSSYHRGQTITLTLEMPHHETVSKQSTTAPTSLSTETESNRVPTNSPSSPTSSLPKAKPKLSSPSVTISKPTKTTSTTVNKPTPSALQKPKEKAKKTSKPSKPHSSTP